MKPDDIVSPTVCYTRETPGGGFITEMFRNPDFHGEPCHTYWGSHGCARPAGHEGAHWCDCCECDDHERDHKADGCVAGPPYYGPETHFYGEGVEGWEPGEYVVEDAPSR